MSRLPTPNERQVKRSVENALSSGKIFLHINLAEGGVDVPQSFSGDETLTLSLSRRFPDIQLQLTPITLKAKLSFGGERYPCVIPYSSIFGIANPNEEEQEWFPAAAPNLFAPPVETLTVDGPIDAEPSSDVATVSRDEPALERPILTLVK